MGSQDKFKIYIQRIPVPSDCRFSKLSSFLQNLGFKLHNKGKTSGSRIVFFDESMNKIILHKPHGSDPVCQSALNDVVQKLKEYGYL